MQTDATLSASSPWTGAISGQMHAPELVPDGRSCHAAEDSLDAVAAQAGKSRSDKPARPGRLNESLRACCLSGRGHEVDVTYPVRPTRRRPQPVAAVECSWTWTPSWSWSARCRHRRSPRTWRTPPDEHASDSPLHRGTVAAHRVRRVASSIGPMLDPKVFKAYDVRGIYPTELDEEGAYAIGRAYVEQFEPRRIAVGRDMRLSSPSMAAAVDRGRRRRRRRRRRHRHGRHRDALFRGRRARPRRRDHGHRLAQPEGVHGHEDRPPRRAAGRRRLGPARRPRPRRSQARSAPRRTRGAVDAEDV